MADIDFEATAAGQAERQRAEQAKAAAAAQAQAEATRQAMAALGKSLASPTQTTTGTGSSTDPATSTQRRSLSESTAGPVVPDRTATTVESGGADVRASGGVWSHGSHTVEPELTRPDIVGASAAFAQELAAGKSVQDLVGTTPNTNQKDLINDAYEVLGVSNRQIAKYTERAARAGVDSFELPGDASDNGAEGKEWLSTLKDAGRIRMAVDEKGGDTLSKYLTFPDDLDGVANLPPELSAAGMVHAVEQGADDSKQFPWYALSSSDDAARDMILGAGFHLFASQNAMFPALSLSSAATRANEGRELVAGTKIDIGLTGAPLLSAELQPGVAAAVANIRDATGTWTEASVAQAVGSADVIMQSVGLEVQGYLQAAAQASGTTAQTPDEQRTAYMAALNKAMAGSGIDLKAATVADTLMSAVTSPAFTTATAGDTTRADLSYNTLAFFDPKALSVVGLAQTYQQAPATGTEAARVQTTRKMLELMSTQSPEQAAPATEAERTDAAGVIAQWSLASLRWSLAGGSKAAGAISAAVPPITEAQGTTYVDYTKAALARASVPDAAGVITYRDAQNAVIGTSWSAVEKAATTAAGISVPADATSAGDRARSVASAIDKVGVAPLLAAGSLATRAYRQTNPQNFPIDQTSSAQLAASSFGDALVITEWLAQPHRFGNILDKTIVGAENVVTSAASALSRVNLAQWDLRAGPVADALAVPVAVGPTTGVGQFLSRWVPQIGGVSNLIYGGFNIGQGIRQIVNGNLAPGVLTTTVGAIDLVNGLAQLKANISPENQDNVWSKLRDVGYQYPASVAALSRFVATGAGIAQVALTAVNNNGTPAPTIPAAAPASPFYDGQNG